MAHEEHKNTQDQLKEGQFDGIQEYDNDLPKWWLGIFYLTIVFGVVYWVHYYVFRTGDHQKEELEKALAAHQARQTSRESPEAVAITDEDVRALITDQQAISEAKNVWAVHCTVCHGSLGEGGIGPNLTDPYWIHGGSPLEIHDVIVRGVPEKGMIAWKNLLTTKQIQVLTAYILTMQGTDPPKAKAPEGERG